MRKIALIPAIILALVSCNFDKSSSKEQNKKKPNILLVVVDDMGWTDTQAYGGEISTPIIGQVSERWNAFFRLSYFSELFSDSFHAVERNR